MSLDPRSRERLEALGRQLPRRLPLPEPAPPAAADRHGPGAARLHPVETEQDPERLFRELMDVSPDGSVPPHLMERLRQLEARRQAPGPAAASAPGAPAPGAPSPGGGIRQSAAPRQPRGGPPRAQPPRGGRGRAEDQDLYTAFQQLLLEDEEPG